MLARRLALASLTLLTALAAGCADDESEGADSNEAAVARTSTAPDKIVDVPFYFGVPKSAVNVTLNRNGYSYPTVWNPSTDAAEVGLRAIVIKQRSTDPRDRLVAHRDMGKQLGKSKVMQDGDVVLAFRPELAGTLAYPHIQMGSTHASLVYTENDQAYNIDSPLDQDFSFEPLGGNAQYSTPFWIGGPSRVIANYSEGGVDAIHILRPRKMQDPRRQASLRGWVGKLRSNIVNINGRRNQIKFQKDYLAPTFATQRKTVQQTVTQLGKIILQVDQTTQQPMYCSEFAWHMLALSNCTDAEIANAGPEGASCVDPVFDPMPLLPTNANEVGLAEGPLSSLLAAPAESRATLLPTIFTQGDAARLSSGHRAVSEQVAPLMPGVQAYFGARASGAPKDSPDMVGIARQVNGAIGNVPNYSPTAFMVQASMPNETRKVDYVTSVLFVEKQEDYDKAKRLSRAPVP